MPLKVLARTNCISSRRLVESLINKKVCKIILMNRILRWSKYKELLDKKTRE